MKKKKLITIGELKKKADRVVQDYFRREKEKCELCFNLYQVLHHFIFKSSSNYLRYDEKNFIFICNKCHTKFHSFPDPMITLRVRKLRGQKWENYITKNRHKLKSDNRKELEDIIEKYNLKP